MANTVQIGNKEYKISELRCGELKKISKIIEAAEEPKNSYAEIEKWMPFILASIKREQPEVTLEELEEAMTLTDFTTVWLAITEISGYKLVAKGEVQPRG